MAELDSNEILVLMPFSPIHFIVAYLKHCRFDIKSLYYR